MKTIKTWLFFMLILASSSCITDRAARLAGNPTPPRAAPAETPEEVHNPPPLLDYPQPGGLVNDFAGVLTARERHGLEAAAKKFQAQKKTDLAVAVIETTGEKSISDYSLEMARQWKIGSENGGLLLVVAINDRKWHIQIDKKLESVLTNDQVKKIGDLMAPDMKKKRYGAGIRKCVDRMIAVLSKKRK